MLRLYILILVRVFFRNLVYELWSTILIDFFFRSVVYEVWRRLRIYLDLNLRGHIRIALSLSLTLSRHPSSSGRCFFVHTELIVCIQSTRLLDQSNQLSCSPVLHKKDNTLKAYSTHKWVHHYTAVFVWDCTHNP